MNYAISAKSRYGTCKADNKTITFTASHDTDQCFFSMDIVFNHWEDAFYLLIPACAYGGNRFRKVKRTYPPMYTPEETGVHCDPLMCDVPSLAPDGTGKMEVTTGDMAVPCVCVYCPEKKQAFMLFTQQNVKEKNLGFTVEKERITISYPANRHAAYRFCTDYEIDCDRGISVKQGEKIALEHKIFVFACSSIAELFQVFFEKRKCLLYGSRPKNMYTKELWDIQERKFNEYNYSGEYYAEISKTWQCGWVGGAMSSYPLLTRGNALSKQRALQTLKYLFDHQAKSGFFYGLIRNGTIEDDSFHTVGMEHVHLVRKSADALYFLFKHFAIMRPNPHWVDGTRKCADAFVKLFKTYGTFGQFVNIETGELIVGCSTAGAMAIGGLVKAWEYFHAPRYLETAKLACDFYYHRDVENGVTSGGPGEILSAPDSESCFAMLESCIVLYEATKEEKWLCYAKACAHLASSWVVAYPYQFPCGSEFGKRKINTVGAVFANVQNKHAAPGICTLSGDSLLKLYRYTQNEQYLDLIKDIAYCIPQCVSTDSQPIYSWSKPPKKLPEGFINERVNMSDWEGFDKVGGVFYGSCWCETSLLLTYCELMQHDEMNELT